MKKIVSLILALLISVAGNFVLLRYVRRYARNTHMSRLMPLQLNYRWADGDNVSDKPVVVFFGDSRADQWDFPESDAFHFVNRGIGGQSSSQVTQRYAAHVAPLNPDIVILQVGINDLVGIPLTKGSKDFIVDRVNENIVATIEQAHASGAKVILTTVFPVGGLPVHQYVFWSADVIPAYDEVNQFIRSLAAEDVIIFDSSAILAGENGRVQKPYRFDFLHLSKNGYSALNAALVPVLETLKTP